jgi:hypothetical protein
MGNLMGLWASGFFRCQTAQAGKYLGMICPAILTSVMVDFPPEGKSIHDWLVVWNMTFIFPYIGNNDPN